MNDFPLKSNLLEVTITVAVENGWLVIFSTIGEWRAAVDYSNFKEYPEAFFAEIQSGYPIQKAWVKIRSKQEELCTVSPEAFPLTPKCYSDQEVVPFSVADGRDRAGIWFLSDQQCVHLMISIQVGKAGKNNKVYKEPWDLCSD